MRHPTTKLLRRTLTSLVSLAALAVGGNAAAQSVTLSGTTSNTCNYASMTVQPNGTVLVTCSGSAPPPSTPSGVAVFAVEGPASLAANTTDTTSYRIRRIDSTGPGYAVQVGYSVAGAGCLPGLDGPFSMIAAQTVPIPVRSLESGSCVITISAQPGHSTSPSSLAITVGTSSPPPDPGPTPPAGCPAIPTSSLNRTGILPGFQAVDQLKMASGVIAYYPVPSPPTANSVIVEYSQTQMANTPAGVITEFQVSKCPGVWDPVGHTIASQCTYRGTFANINNLKIWTAPTGQYTSQASLSAGNCYAPQAEGQYYMNVRWTYSSCPFPEGCGFSNRWVEWASNSP